jgi:hypothetical protein
VRRSGTEIIHDSPLAHSLATPRLAWILRRGGVLHLVGGLLQSAPVPKGADQEGEGVANLSTDSDYNYLAERVNANRPPTAAVNSLPNFSFSIRAKYAIKTEKVSAPDNLT